MFSRFLWLQKYLSRRVNLNLKFCLSEIFVGMVQEVVTKFPMPKTKNKNDKTGICHVESGLQIERKNVGICKIFVKLRTVLKILEFFCCLDFYVKLILMNLQTQKFRETNLLYNFSWNQLFSNFLDKNVDLTKNMLNFRKNRDRVLVFMQTTLLNIFTSGGSGPEFIGFGLACQPCFRVRVHRVSKLDWLSGLSGFRVWKSN